MVEAWTLPIKSSSKDFAVSLFSFVFSDLHLGCSINLSMHCTTTEKQVKSLVLDFGLYYYFMHRILKTKKEPKSSAWKSCP